MPRVTGTKGLPPSRGCRVAAQATTTKVRLSEIEFTCTRHIRDTVSHPVGRGGNLPPYTVSPRCVIF